jgi:nucleoside phosphorylase
VTEPTHDATCILFALARESHFFRRRFPPRERLRGAPGRAWLCGPEARTVLAVETGIGAARAEVALRWLLARPVGAISSHPTVIISAGFSGALQDGFQVGDVVLATEVADPEGNRWPATWPGEARPPWHRGRLLTVPRLAGDPAEKRRLGREHGAAAVDMESAVVARLCREHGVAFGCVRAISDDVHTSLSPRLVALLSGGRVSPARVLAALLASPRLAGELWRLARHTRRAADLLAKALADLLPLLGPASGQ